MLEVPAGPWQYRVFWHARGCVPECGPAKKLPTRPVIMSYDWAPSDSFRPTCVEQARKGCKVKQLATKTWMRFLEFIRQPGFLRSPVDRKPRNTPISCHVLIGVVRSTFDVACFVTPVKLQCFSNCRIVVYRNRLRVAAGHLDSIAYVACFAAQKDRRNCRGRRRRLGQIRARRTRSSKLGHASCTRRTRTRHRPRLLDTDSARSFQMHRHIGATAWFLELHVEGARPIVWPSVSAVGVGCAIVVFR